MRKNCKVHIAFWAVSRRKRKIETKAKKSMMPYKISKKYGEIQ